MNRKMKTAIIKRILSLSGAFIMLLYFIAVSTALFPIRVKAEGDGYWQFDRSEVQGPRSNFEDSVMSGGNGSYHCHAQCTKDYVTNYHESNEHETSCKGEAVDITINVAEPPMTTLVPGEEIEIAVYPTVSGTQYTDSLTAYTCTINADLGFGTDYNASKHFYNSEKEKYFGVDRSWEENDYYGYGGHLYAMSGDNVLTATVPEGKSGSTMWISVNFSHARGEDAITTYYYYKWVDGQAKEAAPKEEKKPSDGKRYWVRDHRAVTGLLAVDGQYPTSYGWVGHLNASGGDGDFKYNLVMYDDDGKVVDEFHNSCGWGGIPDRIEVGKESEVGITLHYSASKFQVDPSGVQFWIRLENTAERSELETVSYREGWDYENPIPLISEQYDYTDSDGVIHKAEKVNADLVLYPDLQTGNGIPDLSEATYDLSNTILVITACDAMMDFQQGACFVTRYIYNLKMPDEGAVVEETDDNNGIFQEDFTEAEKNPGEDEGTWINEDIFGDGDVPTPDPESAIIGGGAAIIGAGALAKSKKKKKKIKKNAAMADTFEEEKKEKSQFKMYINKDFGDSLTKGEEPKYVYARIMEVAPQKWEKERDDLTSKIVAFSGDGVLKVTDCGMTSNGYKAAMVEVPEDNTMEQGEVSFKFVGEGGTYIRHVVFDLVNPGINFAQENLGLPAHYENETRLPFGVVGMSSDAVVTAVIEDKKKGKPVYTVALEQDEEEKRLYYAIIKDVLADDKEEAGTTEQYILKVKAQDNKKTLEEDFKVLRIHMGLVLMLEGAAIGCYLKIKEGHEGRAAKRAVGSELAWNLSVSGAVGLSPVGAMIAPGVSAMKSTTSAMLNEVKSEYTNADEIEPCTTIGKIFLLHWNEEKKSIERIAVVPDKECVVIPTTVENSGKYAHRGEADQRHITMVENLGICVFPTKEVDEHGARTIKLCSTKGALDPPTRMKAELTVRAVYDEVQYDVTKKILLHSMPFRQYENAADEAQYEKWDEHVKEMLLSIETRIYDDYMYNLYSLKNMINRMLDGYDKRFGFDNTQINTVMEVWTKFLKGEHTGARGRAQGLTLADDLAAAYAFLEGMRDNGGMLGRIALGICTAGYSEQLFFAMEIGEKMKQAVFACEGDEEFGFWDGVCLGAKEYAKSELQGLLFSTGLKLGGFMLNTAGKAVKGQDFDLLGSIAKKYRTTINNLDEGLKAKSKTYKQASDALDSVQNFFNSSAKAANESMKKNDQLNAAAEKKAKTTIAERRAGKGTELKSAEEIAAETMYDLAKQRGMNKVRKLWKAQQKMSKAKGTGGGYWEAKAEYEQACKEVWKDKNALKQLKNYDGANGIDMRYEFNRYRSQVKARVSEKILDDIAKETGKKRSELYITSASSNTNADVQAGKTVPEDWDVTVTEVCYSNPGKSDVYLVIDQKIGDDALARNLYKEVFGIEAPTIQQARDMAKKLDATYVQPVWTKGQTIEPNLEAYADLPGMIDKKQFSRDLNALELNRKSFAHKGNEWYKRGDSMLASAAEKEARAKTLFGAEQSELMKEAQDLKYDAIACYVEGTRQITKQTTKISMPRNAYKMSQGAADSFSANAREIQALALEVGNTLSPGEFFHILRTQYGIDKYAYTELMANCLV